MVVAGHGRGRDPGGCRPDARDLVGGLARDAYDDLPRARRPLGHPARPGRRRRGDRRRRDGGRGPPRRPLRVRRSQPRAPLGHRRHAHDRLPLPGSGARLLPRRLPARRAGQRPAGDPDAERLGPPDERALNGLGQHRLWPDRRQRLLRLPVARDLRQRRRPRAGGVLGRPARAALARRRRPRRGALRPLPDRRPERLGHGPHPRPQQRARRAVPDTGDEHQRGRDRGGRVVSVALDISPHLRAARRALLYLVVGLGQGLTYLLVIGGGLLVGVLLTPLWVGLPILAGTARLTWRLAEGERRQANRLLETHLPPVEPVPGNGVRELLLNRPFARAAAMLLLKLPISLAGLIAVGLPVVLVVAMAALGVSGLAGDDGRLVGPWALGPGVGMALCLLALPAAIVSIAALEGVGAGLRALVRRLLRSRVAEGGPVRELLAERLGDRSLSIAYWLPEREIFVDDAGRTVRLPDPGSGRAWTAVDRGGVRLAAIIHDAELDASPELVSAAASAAALAIDNERLKAELRARVEELRVSRLRIVEAADDARRRIERDLHDGAQQQLVSLALDLRMLKARLGDSGLAATVDTLAEKLADALAELRELARGIHPAILSERGIGAAAEALVARAPLDVEVDVRLDERLPAPVEAAAYFVIAEGLTNVVRYAETRRAAVQVARVGGEIEIVVSDDGAGGASVERGTGLRGLADRLAVLDGRLRLESPPGQGTRPEAHVPCMPGSLVAEAAAPAARQNIEMPPPFPGEPANGAAEIAPAEPTPPEAAR